jgi:outer membrane protein assembly factor BamB
MLALLACCAAASGAEQELAAWPQWRGSTHDGHAAGERLIDAFPAGGPPILWVRDLGQGYSGFAVVGGRAFTQTQTLYEQSVVCLDGDTGRTIWSYRCGWPYDGGGLYPGPRSTPTVAEGRVYFATPLGVVGCLTADEGKLVWSLNVNEKFGGRGTEFGYSASPLVTDGLVILPVGGEHASVVALRTEDGSTAWKAGSRPASYATPLPIEWRGHKLVVVLLQNSLACFDRQSGELWWEESLSHGYDEHAAAPLYRDPFLLIAGPFHSGAHMHRLEEDTATGRCRPVPAWFCEELSNDVASSVLVEDTVFGFDLKDMQSRLHRPSRGEFRAVDWLTGQERWSSGEPGHAQIIVADGKLVMFNDRGEVILARASKDEYRELGRLPLFPDEICWTSPALADGRLYMRTQTRAACIYLGAAPLPAAAAPITITAESLAGRRRFDPGALLGGEREYPATLPEWSEFARWYIWSAALVGTLAAVWIGGAYFWQQFKPPAAVAVPSGNSAQPAALFLVAVFIAGAVGSAALHRLQAEYVFTWPLAVWAVFQLAVNCSWATRHSRFWSWQRGVSYAAGLGFLAACGLYFHLCRWLGLAIEWGFLMGFAPAAPAALLFAWQAGGLGRSLSRALAMAITSLASFSLYYWGSVLLVVWWLGRFANGGL